MLRDMHPPTEAQAIHPLMPLRRGHLALVLATGYLNNEIVQDPESGERFLVKGRTEKDTVRTESTEEDGTVVITDRDVLKIVVTALNLDTGTLHSME